MGILWNSVRKDLSRHRRQPLEFLIWLGIPLMIGFLFTLLFSGGGDSPKPVAKVLVVDEDQSFVSGLLLRALSEENSKGFIDAEFVDATSGRARIDRGEATALLTIPEGFSDAVLKEEPLALLLVTNPAQRILPHIVEEGLRIGPLTTMSQLESSPVLRGYWRALAEGAGSAIGSSMACS